MDKKKKFSFFDLSDDSFFNHDEEIEQKEKKDNNVKVENKSEESRIQEAVDVFSKQEKLTIEEKKEENTITLKEQEENNLYPKVEEFVEKKDEVKTIVEERKPIIENNINEQKNIVKTTQFVQHSIQQENTSNLNANSKINSLFDVEEKLDVKTNIYIKKWIYNEVEQIHLSTGKSRSAVINKLLEYALKGVK